MSQRGQSIVAVCGILCCAAAAPAQHSRLEFGHLTIEDGLSHNWVQSLLRDSRGFLWVGTQDGLHRFDGRSFVQYRYSRDDPHSLPGPQAAVLYEDRQKRLWVGAGWSGGGLAWYDRERDRFVRFSTPGQVAIGNRVFDMVEDESGRLWVGTESGLVVIDAARFGIRRYDLAQDGPRARLGVNLITSLVAEAGALLLGTNVGLLRFDPSAGLYTRPGPGVRGQATVPVQDLLRDESGDLWVATLGAGLYRFDTNTGVAAAPAISGPDAGRLQRARVLRLAADGSGRLWAGTENDGLFVLDRDRRAVRQHLPDFEDPDSLSSSSIHALHVDGQGTVWIGTYNGGLNYMAPLRQTFAHVRAERGGLNDPHVASILEDRSGNLWVGTDGAGLNRIDAAGRCRYYRHDAGDDTTLGSDSVLALHEDRRGGIWVGTWGGGLGRLDPASGRVRRLRHTADPTSLRADDVWRIVELHGGELAVATSAGVDLLDVESGRFSRLSARFPGAGDTTTYAVVEDRQRGLWLGGQEYAQHVDGATGRVTTYRHDPADPNSLGLGAVAAVHLDAEGGVWLATEGGLNHLPRLGGALRRYTVADGLPHDSISNILADGQGHLWLSTNRGLSKLIVREGARPRFVNFDRHYGLQGDEFMRGAASRGRDGRLYFGGAAGFNVFRPDEVAPVSRRAPVVLTELRISNRRVVPGAAGSPLAKSITECRELTLLPGHSVVTLEYAALNLAQPRSVRYSYVLEGFDPGWRDAGNERSATYTNLPSGRYVFRVRASSGGEPPEDGLELALRVLPRWHERPSVRLGLLLLVVLALAGGHRIRMRRITAQGRTLARRVEERTQELREVNARLQVHTVELDRLNLELERRVALRTTELEQEKERLAVTLRSIGEGVIATDVDGRVVLVNRVAETVTGWPALGAHGRAFGEILPLVDPGSRQPLPDPLAAVLAGQSALPVQGVLAEPDGRERLIAASAAPIRDSESRVVGIVVVFRDVTERQRVEEQLRNAQKLEALGILAGGIAHDFNNLLTGVFGFIDLASRRAGDPPGCRASLEKALSVLERARGLTGQLLTFSRAGQPVTAPLCLPELLERSVRFALSGSNVSWDMQLAPDLWPCLGDERQLEQVVDNLLLNARQAMPGGGRVTLSADNVLVPRDAQPPLQPGRYLRVRVRDQGEGVPPALRSRIFEPFFTTRATGSGLGLATSYSIVKKHGGHIDVVSEVGVGSSFAVFLPAAAAAAPRRAATRVAAGAGKAKVLLLDDEDYVRDAAGAMLAELGHFCETVADGPQAIQAYASARAAARPFDVVILDLTIPGGLGGPAALQQLRRGDPGVRAIASSGYSGDPIMADPARHGFVDRLAKPYTIEDLDAVLTRVLGR